MSEQKNMLEFKIIYLKNEKDRLRIFGEDFVKNNKDKCEIIYEKNLYDLKEFIDEIDSNLKDKTEIELILKVNRNIDDVSNMFFKCETLKSFSESKLYYNKPLEFDNFEENLENSNELYKNNSISSISSINDIQNSSQNKALSDLNKGLDLLKIFKIKKMSYMFYGCSLLESLPDILSNLDTSEVKDMNHIFHGCTSLK